MGSRTTLFFLFSLFFAFSCAIKEDGDKTIITDGAATAMELSVEENTRTTLSPTVSGNTRSVLWSDGDKVNANGSVSRALSGVEGSTRAVFLFDDVLTLPYNILYPASMYQSASVINLPAKQQYASGTFASGTAPAVGIMTAQGGSLVLKNLCGVIKFGVKGASDVSLQRVVFKGSNGEQLSGEFGLDYAEATMTAQSSAPDSAYCVTLEVGGVALSDLATDFYVVVPPAAYEKGFSVDFENTQGEVMKMVKSSSLNVEKGKIIVMPTIQFEASSDKVTDFDDYYETQVYFSGGSGTSEDPYLISSDWDLLEMADYVNTEETATFKRACYKQVADINLSNYSNFTPIGFSGTNNFQGVYDGGNYTISGLTIDNTLERGSALFGNTGTLAVLKNIHLKGVKVNTTFGYAAALVSYAYKSTISGCSAVGKISSTGNDSGKSYTGGLIGRANGITLNDSSFEGTVTATSNHSGGLVASSDGSSKISNCVLKAGSMVSCNYYAGGIVGSVGGADGVIRSCVCEGKVVSTGWNSGGIAAILYQGRIVSCVLSNTASIESANYNIGGIVGSINTNSTDKNSVAVVDSCAAYGAVKGLYQVGGIVGLAYAPNAGERLVIANCAAVGAEITASGVNGSNYSLAGGLCGWLQGNGDAYLVNSYARPAYVNSSAASAILGTAAIVGYSNSTSHVIDNCYTSVSPAEIQFRGSPVTSSSLNYYGSIIGRASAATPVNRCYYNQALRFGGNGSSHVATSCASYTLSQMTSGTLLNTLNGGLSYVTVVAPSAWVAGADNYPTLSGLPADTQPVTPKKRVSIIGDSISTFEGWIASTRINGKACTKHYPNLNNTDCDVLTVEKTWWYRLIYNYMKNARFEMNISSGNTTVVQNTTATSYSSQYWYNWDFCTRFIGYAGVGNPDIILIHGGTNDYGHIASYGASEKLIGTKAMTGATGPTAGELKPLFDAASACTTLAQAEALPFDTFCSSYIKLLQMIKMRYPNAKVVCIIGDAVSAGMQSAIQSIATYYNAKYVDFLELNGFKGSAPLSKYDNSVHPDAAGMEYMAKTIYNQLGTWLEN